MPARVLSVDIETKSGVDIANCGVYRYVEDKDFEIQLFAYAYNDEPVQVIDLANGEELPEQVRKDLSERSVVKTAFNAQFERVCLNKTYGIHSGPWDCTMVRASMHGFPGSLGKVALMLEVDEDKQKLREGKGLIRLFSKPNKDGMFERPSEHPEKWALYKRYNKNDVEAEREVRRILSQFPEPSEEEKALYALDQKINDRGVGIDVAMARNAVAIDNEQTERFTKRFQELTGIERPSMLAQFKAWLSDRLDEEVTGITKETLPGLIEQAKKKNLPDVGEALAIRVRLGKASIAKYQKMLDTVCEDGRGHGYTQFYGANTGRFSGRLLQVQNLRRNSLSDMETAREAVKTGDFDLLSLLYKNPADILSQCLRPTLIPDRGNKFIVADYSAIEARVTAWITGEKWRMDVFNGDGKIYEASASQMFGVPVEEITHGSDLRQKGKVAELACGYGGGVNALIAMGGEKMGLTEEELKVILTNWREKSPNIVSYWYELEEAARSSISLKKTAATSRGTVFEMLGESLYMTLPSGRKIAYPKARIRSSKRFENRSEIVYFNPRTTTGLTTTWGGQLFENLCQATARDCLAHAMLLLDREGFDIVFHVHDEIICEVPKDDNEALDRMCRIMASRPSWAKDLPLRADGYECNYYVKD